MEIEEKENKEIVKYPQENAAYEKGPPLHTPTSKPNCYSSNSYYIDYNFWGIGVYLAEHKQPGAEYN